MSLWLKQSTAVTVKIGPFVDDTDFKTAETALTISQADIRLSKNGGAFAQSNNAAGATHDASGYYGVPLDTTDTATLGTLRVFVAESGALQVWQDFMVVPANIWDSLFGSDLLQVDNTQILGTAISNPATAGILDVNIKNIDNDAASASGTVTFPNATLASTTNITAGTVTTATNVTTLNGIAANVITAASMAADASAEIATAVFTTALTESYAADGAAFTLAQAMFQMWSLLAEANAAGTTITCKKLDGATTSMTFTIDNAATPATITRST